MSCERHGLLEAAAPAYSSATVRRAFIVWMHCGQTNSFRDVCNYYHHLETLEEQLPADRRACSRHHEFNMFCTPPPSSEFLQQTFPKLYSLQHIQHYIRHDNQHDNQQDACKHDTQQDTPHDTCKLDTLSELKSHNNVTANDILDTSDMIKTYCTSRMIPLRKFLSEFKEFARKCELHYTVNNVSLYIKRKMVEEELLMVENYTKSVKFMKSSEKALPEVDLKLPWVEDAKLEIRSFEKYDDILSDSPKFSKEAHKKISVVTKNKQDLLNRYWQDLTASFGEVNVNQGLTGI